MIRPTAVILLALSTLSLAAQEASDPSKSYLEEFLPYCAEPPTIEARDYSGEVPAGMKADLLTIRGTDPYCGGMFLKVVKGDRIYTGQPWMLSGYEGTIPSKVKSFAWERLKESATATVSDRKNPEGLLEAMVEMTTSWGKIRLDGAVDEDGKVFFPGGFNPIAGGARKARLDAVRSVLSETPRKGDPSSPVELVEFSDFQCPSCRHHEHLMTVIDAALEQTAE
ncbi:MAG: DsbA family protein [Acidobacteria bacterium]|nr:DsbA family protein [Acidobacteriota bacterium]